MDLQRDYPAFKKLIGRLCDTLGKPSTDELVESWWKALRHVDLLHVERRVDEFLARATETTKFPRPSQMRDPDATPQIGHDAENYQRGFWRSVIVHWVGNDLQLSFRELEQLVVAHRDSLGRDMLELLNDLDAENLRIGRTPAMEERARIEAGEIAIKFVDFGSPGCLARHMLNQRGMQGKAA